MLVKPRKAATVAVIKNGSGSIEVLLMKRHGNDRFLPDYHVFPGGALDPQDYDFGFNNKETLPALVHFNGNLKEYISYIMCGIRETFEEAGMLFAVDKSGIYPEILNHEENSKYGTYRNQVFQNIISFSSMLKNENLEPALDRFYYINRWITPPLFPIRYDTRFFAAIAPDNQITSHDGDELVDFFWVSPEAALQSYREGSIKLVMPTIKTLEFLMKFSNTDDLVSHFMR